MKIFDDKIGLMPDGIGPGVSVSGAGDQISAPPLAKKTASLIEKETLKKRMSNIES